MSFIEGEEMGPQGVISQVQGILVRRLYRPDTGLVYSDPLPPPPSPCDRIAGYAKPSLRHIPPGFYRFERGEAFRPTQGIAKYSLATEKRSLLNDCDRIS